MIENAEAKPRGAGRDWVGRKKKFKQALDPIPLQRGDKRHCKPRNKLMTSNTSIRERERGGGGGGVKQCKIK